ncbi:hypothetical protein BJX68DRAFT_261345 [Aspergillus pseudodeflectus]|uniref:DNA replication factor Cdt1 C-terminal domain-containing protein n=1 Tax=Aspergillus pseudodeflectus TaxID=176178 RepID=A0ABR4LA88_9EURO
MGKVAELIKADLSTPESISKGGRQPLQDIFKDDKLAKQVLNASKRASKKRAAPAEATTPSHKRSKASAPVDTATPFAIERALALPVSNATEEELSTIVLFTNRAPLVLAFAVCVLRYTMPEQPISSRLSLAQAVVSANSRSKAFSLGLEIEQALEEEAWGEGQPTVSVLGRTIKVLKRWDYNPREGQSAQDFLPEEGTIDGILGGLPPDHSEPAPPIWGIDVQATKRVHGSQTKERQETSLPIHTPESARSYLVKSFINASSETTKQSKRSKRRDHIEIEAEKEACVGHLLRAIDLVCRSWASILSKDDLDRRAWAWYVHVRPSIKNGVEGWGEKGAVKLAQILALKRQ